MSWTRYLLHDFWTARQFNAMEDQLKARRKVSTRQRLRVSEKVEELEDELDRLALFSRSLAEACIRKGVVSRSDLAAVMKEIDVADGGEDGKITRPEQTPARKRAKAVVKTTKKRRR